MAMNSELREAQRYVRREQRRSPPRYLQHEHAPDWATILYWKLAKFLPDPIRTAEQRGDIAVGETGATVPDMRVVYLRPDNYAVLATGGMLDMILSIALTLWGYDARTLRRVPEPVAMEDVARRLDEVLRYWARVMTGRFVWQRKFRIGRRISSLPEADLDWFHAIVDSTALFMFSHEMAHIELDMKLVPPAFSKEETNADWYGCELFLRAAPAHLHPRMVYTGPQLAMRLFGALQQLGVRFPEDYDPPDVRGRALRTQLRAKCPSQQYFHELATVMVASMDLIDDVMDRVVKSPTPWQPDLDRMAARLIAQLIAVAQGQVPLRKFADDIATLATHTDPDVMKQAARVVWGYYLDPDGNSESYLQPQLRVTMAARLCELMDCLTPALRELFIDVPAGAAHPCVSAKPA